MNGDFQAENDALLVTQDDEKTSNAEPKRNTKKSIIVRRTRFSITRERHDIKSVI